MSSIKRSVLRLLSRDTEEDSPLIRDLIDLVEMQMCNRLGGVEEIPEELEYIATNVVVARYNQIGDEGKSSMSVEGESASWLTDLFEPYERDIQLYLDRRNKTRSGVAVRFL